MYGQFKINLEKRETKYNYKVNKKNYNFLNGLKFKITKT